MKKTTCVVFVVSLLTLSAAAQTKISGKLNCGKPDPSYSLEVGDKPDHVLQLTKATCTWSTPLEMAGTQSKEGLDVSTIEVTSSSSSLRGYNITTMANGDKFTVRYQGSMKISKDGPPPVMEGKWTFTGGTGKLKGLTGGGTFKSMNQQDGSGAADVEGEYTVSVGKAPAKKL